MTSGRVQPGGCREVWRVAFPIVLSTASFTVMQFIDRMFLAWHSEVALRAALPAGMLALTFTTFFQTLAGYSSTFVAQWHGAGRRRECAQSAWQGIWLGLAACLIMLVSAGGEKTSLREELRRERQKYEALRTLYDEEKADWQTVVSSMKADAAALTLEKQTLAAALTAAETAAVTRLTGIVAEGHAVLFGQLPQSAEDGAGIGVRLFLELGELFGSLGAQTAHLKLG